MDDSFSEVYCYAIMRKAGCGLLNVLSNRKNLPTGQLLEDSTDKILSWSQIFDNGEIRPQQRLIGYQ
jgi:hypothetical protein